MEATGILRRKPAGTDNHAFIPDEAVTGETVTDDTVTGEDRSRKAASWRYVDDDDALLSPDRETRTNVWDVFQNVPTLVSDEKLQQFYEACNKLFKVLTIIVTFFLILGCAVISKSTLLFATSQLRSSVPLKCRTASNIDNKTLESACVGVPRQDPGADPYDLYCLNSMSGPLVSTTVCEALTVRWIWCLFLIMVTPYAMTFLRCAWLVCFKNERAPSADVLLTVILQETLYVVGLSIFAFRVLPLIDDVIQSLGLMAGVAVLPSLLGILHRPKEQKLWIVQIILDILAFAAQVSALVLLPVLSQTKAPLVNSDLRWSIPVSLILMSFSWWENYIDKDTKLGPLTTGLVSLKRKLRRTRTKTYLIVSLWKIILTFVMLLVFATRRISVNDLFNWSYDEDRCKDTFGPLNLGSSEWDWAVVWAINDSAGIIGYFCARTASKVNIQRISYVIPLVLTTPVVFGSLVGMCESWNHQPCTHTDVIPGHAFWRCYRQNGLGALFTENMTWMLFVWWLSQLWVARHIFFPGSERLMKTERIFVLPLYENVIFEQWFMHNRSRRDDRRNTGTSLLRRSGINFTGADLDEEIGEVTPTQRLIDIRDNTPLIYICATMWHENETEMVMLLKSIFRLDLDQCARRNAQIHMDIIDPDYYEFEAHIFFDDAMDDHLLDQYNYRCNQFVRLLVSVVDTAASAVHECEMRIPPPTRYPTPYGGRLEWHLPGGNRIIAHIKDKAKIRHKKRWSQVMYMYYFLAYKLWAQEPSVRRKQVKADNTFLLALDGDVDFAPEALMKLVDLMKKDVKMGAACGRIHPIGSGPMVWYQKFEYALGHWMQKATEHVLGCVLCSPGCFSLFRGSAIMDDNIMKKYTTMSTEALHYVQYDQGEDRWLCTLLLQQGYRVEYSAASDSYTFAPEGFNEFYNQRRRWMPSTMANIMDLLVSWRQTINANDNISFLYICYQAGLMISSILGSGTIFLMIVGALQLALNGAIDNWTSLIINLIPVLLFVIVCYKTKSSTQLTVAAILTTIYALLQMLVLVGIMIQIAKSGPCSPTAIFFFYVGGTFLLAAILHPQEFFCVIHGFIYFVSIPSMYMLLMMYSLTNLHVVSWGTREVKPTPTEEANAAQKELDAEAKLAKADGKSKVLAMLRKVSDDLHEDRGWTASLGSWCKCTCCPKPAPTEEGVKLEVILTKLEEVEVKMNSLEYTVKNGGELTPFEPTSRKVSFEGPSPTHKVSFPETFAVIEEDADSVQEEVEVRDELINPLWIEDEALGEGPVQTISQAETLFFQDLIKQYLQPLEKNKAQEERIAMDLLELRDKVSFAYFLLNACFVVVIFTLQANVENISVPWPCGENLRLEPIGFMFLIFFGLMMVLQTIGMLVHRTGTFLHIIATTELSLFGRKKEDEAVSENVRDAIELARNMVRLHEDVSDRASVVSVADTGGETIGRRETIKKIQRQQTRKRTIATKLDDAFQQRLEQLNSELRNESNSAENIGTKVIGRQKTRGKSVRAIKTLQKNRRGGQRSRNPSEPPEVLPEVVTLERVRCESVPEEPAEPIKTVQEVPDVFTDTVTFDDEKTAGVMQSQL